MDRKSVLWNPLKSCVFDSTETKVKAITRRLRHAKDKVIDELSFELSKSSTSISTTPKSPQSDSSPLMVSHSLWKVLSPGAKKKPNPYCNVLKYKKEFANPSERFWGLMFQILFNATCLWHHYKRKSKNSLNKILPRHVQTEKRWWRILKTPQTKLLLDID